MKTVLLAVAIAAAGILGAVVMAFFVPSITVLFGDGDGWFAKVISVGLILVPTVTTIVFVERRFV